MRLPHFHLHPHPVYENCRPQNGSRRDIRVGPFARLFNLLHLQPSFQIIPSFALAPAQPTSSPRPRPTRSNLLAAILAGPVALTSYNFSIVFKNASIFNAPGTASPSFRNTMKYLYFCPALSAQMRPSSAFA